MIVIFDTKREAEIQQKKDFKFYMGKKTRKAKYKLRTKRWAKIAERLDGRFDYETCPQQDYSRLTIKAFDKADYISEGI